MRRCQPSWWLRRGAPPRQSGAGLGQWTRSQVVSGTTPDARFSGGAGLEHVFVYTRL